MTSRFRMVRRLAPSWTVLMAMAGPLLLGTLGCRQKGVLVLVIDSDMAVPGELERIDVYVSGPSQEHGPIPVSLTDPGDPPLPRTLGLVDAESSSAVTITVVGFRGAVAFAPQRVRTTFVDEQTRMVRVVVSAACQGVTCEDGVQTCSEGACVPVDKPGAALPMWTGNSPARPGPLPGEEQLLWSAGWHSCAPRGGTLYCWGMNEVGELGHANGGSDPRVSRRFPVIGLVPKPAPPSAVALGYRHGCVCDGATGLVYCWGANDEGQTGQPVMNNDPQFTPMVVPGITDCKVIAAGGSHTCVVRNNTTVMCWGRNAEGQLGLPASTTPMATPRAVPNLSAVRDIKAGEKFNCVTRTTGGMYCWGENVSGQLGDGTRTSRANNVRVNLPNDASGSQPGITEMALGRFFSCALTDNQTVFCWGENTDGMIGPQPAYVTSPVQIPDIVDAVHLAAGHQHACALRGPMQTISCWGSGQYGQLGNGLKANSMLPVQVLDLTNVTAISAGVVHTCARNLNGVFCWGQNINAQLGDGSLVEEARPVHVIGF